MFHLIILILLIATKIAANPVPQDSSLSVIDQAFLPASQTLDIDQTDSVDSVECSHESSSDHQNSYISRRDTSICPTIATPDTSVGTSDKFPYQDEHEGQPCAGTLLLNHLTCSGPEIKPRITIPLVANCVPGKLYSNSYQPLPLEAECWHLGVKSFIEARHPWKKALTVAEYCCEIFKDSVSCLAKKINDT